MAKAAWNIISGLFLSTPSVRRATPIQTPHRQKKTIPIHALREEGDPITTNKGIALIGISIHALRGEGDAVVRLSIPCDVLFLSTPSARRATRPISGGAATSRNFYPRPP